MLYYQIVRKTNVTGNVHVILLDEYLVNSSTITEWILEDMLTSHESFRRFLKNSNSPTHCHFVWMSRCMQQKQILNHFFFFLNRQSWAMNSFSMYIIILRILKIKGNTESAICFFGMRSDNSESYMFIPAYLNFTEAAFNFWSSIQHVFCHHFHKKVTIGMELKERKRDWNKFLLFFQFAKDIVLILLSFIAYFYKRSMNIFGLLSKVLLQNIS